MSQQKRILIFSLAYYPHVGGAEVAIKEVTDRLSPAEFEFHMLTLRFGNEPREEKIGNVFVHRVGSGKSYFSKILFIPQAARMARRLHREKPFDALWAMMSYMLFPIVLVRPNAPYLLTLQEGDPFEHVFKRWFIFPFVPLLKRGFQGAFEVQAISSYLAKWARGMGFRGEPVVIPNGVDVERFARTKSSDPVKHQVFDKRNGNIVRLVTASRLVHKNGIDTVIDALALLPEHVHFVIYGTGELETALQRQTLRLKLERRVHFRGFLSHADLPRALHECDVFVRPSRSEGMGNSFIEAMAAGLPVIGTQEGGIADFLFDETRNPDKKPTGFVVDKDAPEQVAQKVKEILADPAKAAVVVGNARAMVDERYDWSTISVRMQELFKSVAA